MSEEWDQGLVRFVITDHKGHETAQSQMCWNRSKFIASMAAAADISRTDKDETKHFNFRTLN